MKYITNIDTLSSLLDRLISENIKLYFFKKEKLSENITHQEEVIKEIRIRIKNLLLDVYKNKEYNYISEKRTYKADMTLNSLEQLIIEDCFMLDTIKNYPNLNKLSIHNCQALKKIEIEHILEKKIITECPLLDNT